MSQIALGHSDAHEVGSDAAPHVKARALLREEAVAPPAGGMLSAGLLFAGAVAIIATLILAAATEGAGTQALAAYHSGVMFAVSLAVGALGFVMMLQQFNAGWSAVIRRQLENVASVVPVCFVLFLPVLFLAKPLHLFHWMHIDPAHDPLLEAKKEYLNFGFWAVRALIYFVAWTGLSLAMYRLSRAQDETGDKWLTARARRISSWGLLVFAFTSAFAAFDWLMAMDFTWFSTMFGVRFFAGCLIGVTALCIVLLGMLRMRGKLEGVVTVEHFHDLGKLLLSFTVFWAYIGFSEYFLIWYANIPEEGWFFQVRQQNGWRNVFLLLAIGHFVLPFLVLLFRASKRRLPILMGVAVWVLLMHAVEAFFIVMPNFENKRASVTSNLWLDVIGMAGPICLFLGAVLWRVRSGPLVPLKDPRLHESLEHKNYV